ncbi:MAG: nuclear transport factor 2 family protein [Ginsengibacter sp.]
MKNIQNELMSATQQKQPNTDATKKNTLSDSSRKVLMNHLGSFRDNDLEAVMSDYTNESVLITHDATYIGLEEIEAFFTALVAHFPRQKSSFELDKMIVEDELVYIVWHAKTPTLDVPLGSDTFIIKDGKIYQQTFVGQMKFIN